ncbi:hypothetical protein VM1G_08450 [Cytospora mali]|uniref:Uncharacterized protein n=1 Tax=Cytospora mali TaxID=578113 RepID=A0A194W9U8_CYTMA|nr:hypothetical protein VM1G_08450 [Valsa mali]
MSGNQHDNDSECTEKCGRLEQLLREVLALAGEIAEEKGQERAKSVDDLPGECIILRKASVANPTGAKQRTRRHSFPRPINFGDVERESEESQDPPAESSVQEPFSPGTLALSLDAMVEGDSSDSGSCILDSGSSTPFANRLPEPNKKSSLSSIEEVKEPGAITRPPSPLQITPTEGSPELRRRAPPPPPPSKTTSTQTPASPYSPDCLRVRDRSSSTQSCPLPGSHAPLCRGMVNSRHSMDGPLSPMKGAINRYETTGGTDQTLPCRWQVRIVPIPCFPSPGVPPSTTPAFVKLEAVFPYRFFADGNAASPPGRSSEGSYIIIGRPPLELHPGDPHSQDCGQDFQAVPEKSLQDYIDEWDDFAAGTPEVDDAR